MDERFKHICKTTMELFLERGVKNTSMDDISSYLRISKKTLYQYVDNKEDLLTKIMDKIKNSHSTAGPAEWLKNYNAIDVFFIASNKIYNFQMSVKKPFRFDMEKYYPHLWNDFMNRMREKTYKFLKEIIKDGIQDGLFREDLDIDMTATMYNAKIEGVHLDFARNPEKYTYRQLFEALFEQQIRAIATEKGIKHMEEQKENFKIETGNNLNKNYDN